MKKQIVLMGFLVIAALQACGDDYLAIVPEDSITVEEFLETTEDAQMLLNGAYDALSSKNSMGGLVQLLAELAADNFNGSFLNNNDWQAHYTWTTDIFLGTTRESWRDTYYAIGRANLLMDNFNVVEGLSDEERRRMEGEAKFIRAVGHFEMVRLFAQPYGYTSDNSHLGVPVVTTFSNEAVNRASVTQVYEQVINDLKDSEELLAETLVSGYASSWSARAYLAKVYFQMNDFENAYNYADLVIESGLLSLEMNALNRFSLGVCSESAFELASFTLSDNAGEGFRDHYLPDISTGVPKVALSSSIYQAATADTADLRGKNWYVAVANATGVGDLYFLAKFAVATEINVPLAHLTELKLIRAESAAELGTNLEVAINDINDLRLRANLLTYDTNDPNTIISIARHERRLELVGEGNRLHELKRQGVHDSPELLIRAVAPWDCPGMVCQMPDNELKGNPDMEPNPSGGCN